MTMKLPAKYRLSIDLGSTSIGWAALYLDDKDKPQPTGILDMGSRIFSDGRDTKTQDSLAKERREKRGVRRNRDRYLRRRKRLVDLLVKKGFMPAGKDEIEREKFEKLDPYELRAKALQTKIEFFEIGRAIFHLNQRRGFQNNRKIDKGDDSGKIKKASNALEEKLKEGNFQTLGEFLYKRHAKPNREPVRVRPEGEGAKLHYEFYPLRDMLKKEFDLIIKTQSSMHNGALKEEDFDAIRDVVFYQRPLKPVKAGKCTLYPTKERAAKSLPISQERRIYEEVNHLRLVFSDGTKRDLTLEERDIIVKSLKKCKAKKFKQMRKDLKIDDAGAYFNSESEKRKELKGDETAAVLSQKKYFGKKWREFSFEEQSKIVSCLLYGMDSEKDKSKIDDDTVRNWLMAEYELDEDNAESILMAPLPSGYASLSICAMEKLLPELKREVITYNQAVENIGLHHSDFRDGEIHKILPYYGKILERHVAFGSGEPKDIDEVRYGKIANPSVHIALGQIRLLINALIKRYGRPYEVVIEVTRDLKNSVKQKKEINEKQKENQDKNDGYRDEIRAENVKVTRDSLLRMRLWEELAKDPLNRRCPYTGRIIAKEDLFSGRVEIEHILPFSRTLDNSRSNKTLSYRAANRIKGNKSPYEAFSDMNEGEYNWGNILLRSANLPKNKKWRFLEDAMERYEKEEKGFLSRHLNDTAYISRMAVMYVSCLFAEQDEVEVGHKSVWSVSGRLTGFIRHHLGLNSILSEENTKNRENHKHHTIDAVVIGLTSFGMLGKISAAATKEKNIYQNAAALTLKEPWQGFRQDVQTAAKKIVVSHRPEHGLQTRLHAEYAYGAISEPNSKKQRDVVMRKALSSFEKKSDIEKIRDDYIRKTLLERTKGLKGKEFKEEIAAYSKETSTRRLRIIKNNLSVIPIKDKKGRAYKYYETQGNAFYEIFMGNNGKWAGNIISSYDANQLRDKEGKLIKPARDKTLCNKGLIMRLYNGDMVLIEEDGRHKIMRVQTITKGRVALAEHFEANADARNRERVSIVKKQKEIRAKMSQPDFSENSEEDTNILNIDTKNLFAFESKSPSSLQKCKARRIFVTILGHVRDTGFYDDK